MIFFHNSIQKSRINLEKLNILNKYMKTLCRSSISRFFFSFSVVLTLLLLSLLPSVDIYFLFLGFTTSCHCLSSTFFFNTSSTANHSKILQHISPLRSLSIQTSFHSHISHPKAPSPSSFPPTPLQRFSGDYRRICCLLTYHTIPLVLSMRRTTQ